MANPIDSLAARFRSCPVTGLKVDLAAQGLIKINAVMAVVCMLVGAIAAFGLALTRWQAVHLLPAHLYYRFLTLHGLNMLIFFIVFFEMAILYFAGPVLLNCRLPKPWVGWLAFVLMLVGMVMVNTMVLLGKADVTFTSYVPLKADPNYYLGVILFAVGALIVSLHFFAVLVVAKREKTYQGAVPLVTFGALTAAIIAVIALLHGALIYVPTYLWSLGVIKELDPEVYRLMFWALGHSTQQINVSAHVAVWYLLAGLTVGGVVVNEKISRSAFFLYVLFISMASAHHLLVDPGFGPAWKVWNTSYAMYLAVLASMIHGFTVPAGVETGMRLRGFRDGRFGWLRKAPWGDPGFSGLVLSVVIFGFLGGITGVTLGTEQINIIAHNTLRIPGHFHTTVVGGTALAFMAVTYYVLPLIFERKVRFWFLARLQPWIFGGGIVMMSMSMIFLGIFGAPRRHWDMAFTDSPYPVAIHPAAGIFQAGLGIGGSIAATGALIYILIAVATVFFGEKVTAADFKNGANGLPQGLIKLPPQAHSGAIAKEVHKEGARGTMVLVFIFLAVFILYYFTNWKILSFAWLVG